jgi:hypothetical protein
VDELHPTSKIEPDRLGGPVSSVDRQIAELEGMDLEALRALWRKLYRKPAPRFFRRELLVRGLANQIQVKAYGGLAPKSRRKLLRIAAEHEAGAGFTTADAPRRVRPGTRLVRAWKGVTHSVNVLDDGFEWNGTKYRSLSAIARAISGTSWNGHNFFGLDKRKGGKDG